MAPIHEDRSPNSLDATESDDTQQQQPGHALVPGLPLATTATTTVEPEEAAASARAIEGSAFSAWKESLSSELESGLNTLKARVHALQSEFDEASMFIRGDLAWRKQVGSFHDNVNDILHGQMERMVAKLKENTDTLSFSITESFNRKEQHAKSTMARQAKMYEDKLRRTRTSLKKEIDRFTHLEKCLRKEEAFQAKEMYDDLVLQLTNEHAAKEASLHALLRELRSSYSAMEVGNTQLMDSLKTARAEVERMKSMLIKQTTNVSGPSRRSLVRSPTRFSSVATPSTTGIQDVYVQSLKQSLSTSAQTIDALKKQVAELTSDKESSARKARLAEDATSKVNDELAKVTQLLAESHAALIANKKATEQAEREKRHWEDLFLELQFRTESSDHEIEAAKQLADATREQIAFLEQQVKRLATLELQKRVIAGAFADWLDQEPEQRDFPSLQKMVEAFLNNPGGQSSDSDGASDTDVLPLPPVKRERRELEIKLRYEYEKRYGDQLNQRVSHERKRVLARIEMLCANQQQQADAAAITAARSTRQPTQRAGADKPGRVSYKVVHKIVSDAYDQLGFSEWSVTDIDFLHSKIESLQAQLAQHHLKVQSIERFAEAQGMALAKAELLQQEKEYLLAELTEKYRELRATQDALFRQQGNNETALEPATELTRFSEEVPLTVYGHPQRLELKKLRAPRPASASPCVVSVDGDREEMQQQHFLPAKQRPDARPMSSAGPTSQSRGKYRVGSARQQHPSPMPTPASHPHPVKPFLPAAPTATNPDTLLLSEPQQQVEHIRSVLKSELLQISPAENQLEDGSHLGPDGVRVSTVEKVCSLTVESPLTRFSHSCVLVDSANHPAASQS